jgi:2-keto-3-deoxy-L-rhamnonate aldolase RhmA
MADRGLKAMAGSRKPKFGHFIVEFVTPGIGHILRSAGAEFVLLDLEHSGFSFETVKSAIRYFEAAGVAVICRVPSKNYDHISRACDMGAEGIMVPMVGSPGEARAILDSMKYHPEGKRGVALQIAHDNYRPGDVDRKQAAANDRTMLFCQIETAEGVRNVEKIAALPGVDGLWVGHFDLSTSLGVPGRFEDPKFIKAITRVTAAAERHGKALGRLVPTVESGIDVFNTGFDFVCYSGDVWVLHNALAEALTKLRAACGGKAGRKTGIAAAAPKGPAKRKVGKRS